MPIPEEVREAMARAIYALAPMVESGEYVDGFKVSPDVTLTWDEAIEVYGDAMGSDIYETLDAALSALEAAGWACVPVEPTEEMIAQAWIKRTQMDEMPSPQKVFAEMWRVMLSASQEQSDV